MTHQIAIVFPGQGSQTIGMLKDLASQYNEIRHTFLEAAEVLDYDLWEIAQQGPSEILDQTTYTQPILLTASYALWKILSPRIVKPSFLAGHSLGEYTALVCANALNFKDALRLVSARGQFMQEAVSDKPAGMAALVGLDENTISDLCQRACETDDEVLSPANFNSIGQIVIAGHVSALERAIIFAKEAGAKIATRLPVSVPSHCILMKPASEKLANLLDTISIDDPEIPIINNVSATPYQNKNVIKEGLTNQLFLPVQWIKTIQYLIKQEIYTIIECGPGKILSGLNKRIDKRLQSFSSADPETLHSISSWVTSTN